MLEAKPPSPGSGAAAHIHGHRRWAAPLLASLLLSIDSIFLGLLAANLLAVADPIAVIAVVDIAP